jgi:hypothetical protein
MRALAAWAAALCAAAAPAAQAADTMTGRATGIGADIRSFFGEADLQGLSLGTGLHYSTGDYGTGVDTEIISVPLMARYERDRLILKLTVPWIEISGGASVIPGVGAVTSNNPRRRGGAGATATTDASASGLGDTVASATYAVFYDSASRSGIDLTGRVKLPTADEDEGLGTGETDFGAQVDVYKAIDDITYFGGVGYTVLGDAPNLALKDDVWNINLGASYKIDSRDSAGLSYDWRQPLAASSSRLSEITAFWVHSFDRRWKGQAYFLKGLSDGSPDWGVGAFAYYSF